MHLLITRPQPEADALAAHLATRGVASTIDPLLVIKLSAPHSVDLEGVQALIATSRNGLRGLALSPALEAAKRLPIYVVGPGTASYATELGFTAIITGPGSAGDLVELITRDCSPTAGPLLHLSGDKIAFDLAAALAPAGLRIDRRVVYRSVASAALLPMTLVRLNDGTIDTVILTSPLAAATFVAHVQAQRIIERCQRLVYICLSQGIATRLRPLNPVYVHVAPLPNSQSTLEIIDAMVAREIARAVEVP